MLEGFGRGKFYIALLGVIVLLQVSKFQKFLQEAKTLSASYTAQLQQLQSSLFGGDSCQGKVDLCDHNFHATLRGVIHCYVFITKMENLTLLSPQAYSLFSAMKWRETAIVLFVQGCV